MFFRQVGAKVYGDVAKWIFESTDCRLHRLPGLILIEWNYTTQI